MRWSARESNEANAKVLQHIHELLHGIDQKLDHIHRMLHIEEKAEARGQRHILKEIDDMSAASEAAMARLTASVAEGSTVDQSILDLVSKLADEIRNSGEAGPKLIALADELDASNTKIKDAVRANTSEPPPVEEPPVE